MNAPRGAVLLSIWVTAVVAAVVTGLYLLGSPSDERARRMDARRVVDLQAIAAAVDVFRSRHTRLPSSLEELSAEPGITIGTVDPSSSQAYAYQRLDSLGYEVCATFERESEVMISPNAQNIWAHPAGRHCFGLAAEEIRRRREGPR